MDDWQLITRFTIYGDAASKANSRRSVPRKGGGNMFIKSRSAMSFEAACQHQTPVLPSLLDEDGLEVWADFTMVYPSLRSDLDPSIVLDRMQGRIYSNDVCVTKITTCRAYDGDPRVDVVVYGRPWLIHGKIPKMKATEALRQRLRAESMAARPAKPAKRRSGKA